MLQTVAPLAVIRPHTRSTKPVGSQKEQDANLCNLMSHCTWHETYQNPHNKEHSLLEASHGLRPDPGWPGCRAPTPVTGRLSFSPPRLQGGKCCPQAWQAVLCSLGSAYSSGGKQFLALEQGGCWVGGCTLLLFHLPLKMQSFG